jgi:general secretion pathway protein E
MSDRLVLLQRASSSTAALVVVGVVTVAVVAAAITAAFDLLAGSVGGPITGWLGEPLVRIGAIAVVSLWLVPVIATVWRNLTAPRVHPDPEDEREHDRRRETGGAPGGLITLSDPTPQSLAAFARELSAAANADDADVVLLLDRTLSQAIALHASDVHFEPGSTAVEVRFRIDGSLVNVAHLPRPLHSSLVNRLKVLSDLRHFERDTPQDGRIFAEIMGESYDIRSSFLPTIHGEKAALRIFETGGQRFELRELGFSKRLLDTYLDVLGRPQGIVFVTGPTGSGKTTTMYASLRSIKAASKGMVNIATLEDPVEYALPDFSQTQVRKNAGLTFAVGLRTILRQDPDVIMVGEIRDLETAQVALQAGLTGHMMLTTVHSDSTAGVFSRLVNMGCEPFLLASSSIGVLSQRLVRRLCEGCRQPCATTGRERRLLELAGLGLSDDAVFYVGSGCGRCFGSGFRGRVPIGELMVIDEEIKEAIINKRPTGEIERIAVERGMRTLLEDGLAKALVGTTSVAEVLRVTR